jgi:hypothetical protein
VAALLQLHVRGVRHVCEQCGQGAGRLHRDCPVQVTLQYQHCTREGPQSARRRGEVCPGERRVWTRRRLKQTSGFAVRTGGRFVRPRLTTRGSVPRRIFHYELRDKVAITVRKSGRGKHSPVVPRRFWTSLTEHVEKGSAPGLCRSLMRSPTGSKPKLWNCSSEARSQSWAIIGFK